MGVAAFDTFDLHAAVSLHEERESDMLASLERLRKRGGEPMVSELVQALQSLDLCDGIDSETIERVVLGTAAELGHTLATPLSHDSCVRYYNALVDFVNSYEARLADPSRNCTPQYTVAGLDMPHTFWINLDRVADRRASMQRLLRGYAHTRVPAVDASGDAWWSECEPLGLGRPLKATAAERCCTMSHLAALEAIRATRAPLALVLEDDITFKFIPQSFSFAQTVSALPADWDVLHVSARSNPPSKLLNIPYQFCEWRPKLCYSTAAYLVNGGHIDAIISKMRVALLTGKEARADWVIYGSVTTYVLTRPLIDEDPFHFASEIHSENEEYHRHMHVALSELYCNEERQRRGLPLVPLSLPNGFRSATGTQLRPGEKPPSLPLLTLDDLRAMRNGTYVAKEAAQAAPPAAAEGAQSADKSANVASLSACAASADVPEGNVAGETAAGEAATGEAAAVALRVTVAAAPAAAPPP
ncbi:hypothetical protein KFE25_002575 [Diacronema lutheri]|uniref:Glycosyl transferase family 25 domain-containing protein n=2 Tax=Diacronema lutheri TaxID=2081491 RepID=A0A8J5XIR6_DIALT|nr:hypothetical protein KFE25_002575 [Diacronema lutheri]